MPILPVIYGCIFLLHSKTHWPLDVGSFIQNFLRNSLRNNGSVIGGVSSLSEYLMLFSHIVVFIDVMLETTQTNENEFHCKKGKKDNF